jgi:hypothetical protein
MERFASSHPALAVPVPSALVVCRGFLVVKRSFERSLQRSSQEELMESSSQRSRHEAELRKFASLTGSDAGRAAEAASQRRKAALNRAAALTAASTSLAMWTETLPYLALIAPSQSLHSSLLGSYTGEKEAARPVQPLQLNPDRCEESGGEDEEDAIESVD